MIAAAAEMLEGEEEELGAVAAFGLQALEEGGIVANGALGEGDGGNAARVRRRP